MPTRQQSLYVTLQSNVRAFRGDMLQAGAAVDRFGHQVAGAGTSISKLKMLAAGAGAAVGAGFVLAARNVIELDKAMRNVQSITKQSEGSLQGLESQAIRMSTKLPQSAKTIAEGMYDIASSGFTAEDAMTQVATAASTAASAGMTDMSIAAGGDQPGAERLRQERHRGR
jgi:hypothetical protein